MFIGDAHADGDFGKDADQWNGVGYLVDTAQEARVRLEPVETLDLGVLEPGDLVLAIQPRTLPPPAELLRFVNAGGYFILAAEGERFRPVFEAFGVSVHEVATESDALLPDATAVATRGGSKRLAESFLFFNVDAVQTNHAEAMRVLSDRARGVLAWSGTDDQLVVEVRIGAGSVLLVSDASVFINHMLRKHYGNKQLAANALRYFCEREPCKAWFLGGDASLSGTFDEDMARFGPLQREFRAFVARVNTAIPTIVPPGEGWLLLLAVLALGCIPLALRLVQIARRPLRVGGSAPDKAPPVEVAEAFAARRGAADFGALALALAEFAVAEVARDRRKRRQHAPAVVAGAIGRLEDDARRLRERNASGVSSEFFVRVQGDVEAVLDYLRPRARQRLPTKATKE